MVKIIVFETYLFHAALMLLSRYVKFMLEFVILQEEEISSLTYFLYNGSYVNHLAKRKQSSKREPSVTSSKQFGGTLWRVVHVTDRMTWKINPSLCLQSEQMITT